ncbi:MAG: tRNA (N(6)-L-threonylcarbamoyladenosine(37)-C(2))-methylthiotransferase MtaB [Bacteroidetes bacterium]|nr:tRNA (N(6)-L-threonylcarbamoyladenosine(37)-C(2))-methylthiotransferase MtaB [Bacteroidota bacterium]
MNGRLLRVAFHTLGCKLNFAETSTIARSLPAGQFRRVSFNDEADIYIINTCSVTDAADRKCRHAIRKITGRHPGAFVAVVGCYAQLNPGAIASIPGVDLVLGTNEKFDIPRYISNLEKRDSPEVHSCEIEATGGFNPSWSAGDRTRSFLKVQDGCDYKCSYCTIPLARGRSRNLPVAECIEEANRISASGAKEIVLTGINTGDFGKSTGEKFTDLLKELVRVEGIERYRISSIEPNLLTDEVIEMAAAGGRLMPHFHIPLQSGCNKTLAAMKRRYTRELFAERVLKIRKLMPLAGIGADVITGFPGETETDFEETFTFLTSLPLSYMHIFRFSVRPGTAAADLPGRVPHKTAEERSQRLIKLSAAKKHSFIRASLGTVENVLFENTKQQGMFTGFTPNYIKVLVRHSRSGLAGEIRPVRLSAITDDGDITGEIVK